MNRPSLPALSTRVGQARHGDNHFFGFSVATELAGCETVTGLIAMSVTGRRLSPEERAVLDDIAVVMTVADPRIWPLKLTRVLSAYGSALPAMAAANLCIERAHIGHFTTGIAAERLVDVANAVGDAVTDEERLSEAVGSLLARHGRFMGFGVPFRAVDERVATLGRCIAARNRERHRYWRLFGAVSAVMLASRGLRPNVGLAVAAACLDLGLTPREISLIAVALGQTDYLANAVEGALQAPGVLRELPADRVRYVGQPARVSERSSQENAGRGSSAPAPGR